MQPNLVDIIVIAFGYILAIVPSQWIVRKVLRSVSRDLPDDNSLARAGRIIGVLERILVFTLVLLGEYLGIAVVFTAKSIARFENLNKREFAEYYLIGTLTSVICAMFAGFAVRIFLQIHG